MSSSQLKKFIVTPVLLSAAVFSALTLPLAVFGSKPVTIQFQSEPVFHGQLRDVASPYLGLATALSLGTGVACVALTGWRQSTRKSSKVEEELSELAQSLKKKEAELEALKLSESQLRAHGLSAFLGEEATQKLDEKVIHEEPIIEAPVHTSKTESVVEPLVITTQPLEAQPMIPSAVTVQAAAAKFASAQTFLGYTQAHAAAKPSSQAMTPASHDVEQLHSQLQQIMAQMAAVQAALAATPSTVKADEQLAVNPSHIHVLNTWSVHKTA